MHNGLGATVDGGLCPWLLCRTKPPIKAERDLDWKGVVGSSNLVEFGFPLYFWEAVVIDDFYDEKMSRTQEALAATPDMSAQRQFILAAMYLNKGDVVLDVGVGLTKASLIKT